MTKKPYEIVAAFWLDGALRQPGQPDLILSEPEAKYHVLGGHIRERKPEAAAVVAPAADTAKAGKAKG